MPNYTAKQGDTFELVSRKMYGTEYETDKLRRANPSLTEPFTAGDVLYVPSGAQINSVSADEDTVTVLINGREFIYFTNVNLKLRFDSFDSCSITSPFEFENKLFRETFIPFSYSNIQIYIGTELVFSGIQIAVVPQTTAQSKTVTIEAYATAAITNDTNLPISSFPIELRGMKLSRIAETICTPFPFSVISDADNGATFETAAIKHTDTIAEFLTTLCKQRDLVLTNNENGDLYITKATTAESIVHLRDDTPPVLSVTPKHDEQNYFSDYTAILPVIIGLPIASYTAKNKKLTDILRVKNFMARDASNGEERQIAESRRSRGLANSVSYSVELATIRDPADKLYKPNSFINLYGPSAMIYTDYKFFIRSLDMELTPTSKSCSLDIVLPEAYNGDDVEVLPWEE